ncbi:MAG: DUF1569 domain-containing protein [Flavobacteriales bacterium]|jgi:hypothetical protein|nr:DUF1569 domain-containing protein [Flavobacteriales bacterium]
MKLIFDPDTLNSLVNRIDNLNASSNPLWGKMSVNQMLAHCSLTFEYNNGQRQAKVRPILRFLLRPTMRKTILSKKPYKKNGPTAPYFKVPNPESFELEKTRLITNLTQYSKNGPPKAEAIEHVWLGHLSAEDWSWLMFKHLNHHLEQFNV